MLAECSLGKFSFDFVDHEIEVIFLSYFFWEFDLIDLADEGFWSILNILNQVVKCFFAVDFYLDAFRESFS